MSSWSRVFDGAILIGTAASVTSTLALGLLARAEGKGVLQPVNATSHWLHGEQAAACTRADFTHTAVGYATHHAATIFWAALFAWWIAPLRPLAASQMLQRATAMSAFAAAVDYLATPKRFTPGWEFSAQQAVHVRGLWRHGRRSGRRRHAMATRVLSPVTSRTSQNESPPKQIKVFCFFFQKRRPSLPS